MKSLVVIVLFCGGHLFAASKAEEIACSAFADSPAYSEVLQLPKSPDPLMELLSIASDVSKRSCWSNAMWMIGVLGDDAQTIMVINRISRDSGEIDIGEWGAKSAGIFALGFFANKGSEKALSFLERLVNGKSEKKNLFGWTRSREGFAGSEFNLFLARIGVQALGLSGRSEAKIFLEKFKNDPQLKDVVATALPFIDRVQKVGLAGIYH